MAGADPACVLMELGCVCVWKHADARGALVGSGDVQENIVTLPSKPSGRSVPGLSHQHLA